MRPNFALALRRAWPALAFSALMTACGGGGGADPAPVDNTPAPVSPTPSTGVAVSGTITGFGSVIIDGVKYDDTAASVSLDHNPAALTSGTLGDLKLGMRVEALAQDGKLKDVVVRANLVGSVSSVDATNGRFTVLSQTVSVTSSGATPTLFEGLSGLSALASGDVVAVFGVMDANQVLVATRVERKPASELALGLRVGGQVAQLDANTKTFKVRDLTVSYANASVLPEGTTLANGQAFEAFAEQQPVAGVFTAKSIKVLKAERPDAGTVVLGGRVVSVNGLADVLVNTTHIDASSATISGGAASDVIPGVTVGTEGTVNANGVLVAKSLRIMKTSVDVNASLSGAVTDWVNAASFKVRGQTVDASTAALDGGALTDLGNGVRVEVKGSITGEVLKATSVKFQPQPAAVEVTLLGEVRELNVSEASFRFLAARFHWTDATQFVSGTVADLANGKRVEAVGKADANGVIQLSKVTLLPDLVPQPSIVSGRISEVSLTGFKLNDLSISLASNVELVGGTALDLVNGASVIVRGTFNAQQRALVVTRVEIVKPVTPPSKGEAPSARLEGVVSDWVSLADFRVAGQRVDASAASVKEGLATDLANGKRVVVEGKLQGDPKVLKASVLRFLK